MILTKIWMKTRYKPEPKARRIQEHGVDVSLTKIMNTSNFNKKCRHMEYKIQCVEATQQIQVVLETNL